MERMTISHEDDVIKAVTNVRTSATTASTKTEVPEATKPVVIDIPLVAAVEPGSVDTAVIPEDKTPRKIGERKCHRLQSVICFTRVPAQTSCTYR